MKSKWVNCTQIQCLASLSEVNIKTHEEKVCGVRDRHRSDTVLSQETSQLCTDPGSQKQGKKF